MLFLWLLKLKYCVAVMIAERVHAKIAPSRVLKTCQLLTIQITLRGSAVIITSAVDVKLRIRERIELI